MEADQRPVDMPTLPGDRIVTQPLDLERLDPTTIEQRREAAQKMVSDLCHRRREWILSIPARRDYDPDLVIGDSLRDIPKLLDALAAATARAEAAEAERDRARRWSAMWKQRAKIYRNRAAASMEGHAHEIGNVRMLINESDQLRADLAAAVERAEGLRRLLDTAIDYLNSESMWEVVDELRAKVEALAARTEGQDSD